MRWRFLDKVTLLDPWRAASGEKAVSLEEYLLLDPFGRKGQFPETLILESCVELVRWLVERSSGFERTCILAEIERFSLRSVVGMGDVLTLRADVAARDAESLAVVADVPPAEREASRRANSRFAWSAYPNCSTVKTQPRCGRNFMARLREKGYTYFTTVRGMCRSCREIVPARVFFRDGQVWQESLCPRCQNVPALIAGDQAWYLDNVLKSFPDRSPLKGARPPQRGCPHDCGPCRWHATPCQLPVISITNACNLNCPICFTYNRKDPLYFMPLDALDRTLDWVVESSGPVDLINITGGEPTLHPDILAILERCRRPEIGRVTMNSNGIKLAEDEALCRRLAELGVYVILSFNTFDPATSALIHGRDVVATKLKAIENLTAAGVRMTLLHVMIRDLNERAAGELLDLMRANDNILSLTVQTMTYTGQGGGAWQPRRHIPVDEASRIVCAQSGGAIELPDFLARPSAHPLCYSICYMLKTGEKLVPFTCFATRERITEVMKDSYLIRLSEGRDFFRDVVNELYAKGDAELLKPFRRLVEELYPADRPLSVFERQRAAESAVRTVYVHSHMDEDTFDCSRAMLCPDLVPAEPGRLIPACTYNLFYRMKDERFYVV